MSPSNVAASAVALEERAVKLHLLGNSSEVWALPNKIPSAYKLTDPEASRTTAIVFQVLSLKLTSE